MKYFIIIFTFLISFLTIQLNAQVHTSPNKELFKNQKIKLDKGWEIDSSKYGYLLLRDTIKGNRVTIYTEENADRLDAKTISSLYYKHSLSDSTNTLVKDSTIVGSNFNGYWTLLNSKNIFGAPLTLELCVINFGTRTFFIESVFDSKSLLLRVLNNTSYIGQTITHLKQKQKYFFLGHLNDGFKHDTKPNKILLTPELLSFFISKEPHKTSSELRYYGNETVRFSQNYENEINDLRVYGYEKGYSIISYDMTEDISNGTNTFPEYYGNIVLRNQEGNTLIVNYSAIIFQEGLFLKRINIGTVSYGGVIKN